MVRGQSTDGMKDKERETRKEKRNDGEEVKVKEGRGKG